MAAISKQLEKTLSTYAHQVDANLIAALAKAIRDGANASFIDEFAAAIQACAFTPRVWGVLTRTDLDDDDFAETDKDLRFIWSQVAPDRRYPGDDPSVIAPEAVSDRLRWAIEGGCHQVDALLIASLAESIRAGGMPWFVDEFTDAISNDALTPHLWGLLTHTDLEDDGYAQTDKDLRFVWSQVAPDRPYPRRQSRTVTAAEPLSERLKDAIALYCHHVDALLIESLVDGIKLGALDWFVNEFAEAIRAGQLMPAVWGKLTETDLDADDYAETDKDLRFVWSQVAPGQPFPRADPG